jgi:hypothetical protein
MFEREIELHISFPNNYYSNNILREGIKDMKRFSQCKLIKELIILFTFGVTILLLLYSAFPDYYHNLHAQAQLQPQPPPPPLIGIKITSPTTGQQVPVGELTISGISTDNATTDCTVYADINNLKPLQKAVATGPGGVNNDYSTWTFTYTDKYHLIANGTNNLTSKLSCFDDGNNAPANLTKFYSVNVIGVVTIPMNNTAATTTTTSTEQLQQQESPTIESNISTIIENNGSATKTTKMVKQMEKMVMMAAEKTIEEMEKMAEMVMMAVKQMEKMVKMAAEKTIEEMLHHKDKIILLPFN